MKRSERSRPPGRPQRRPRPLTLVLAALWLAALGGVAYGLQRLEQTQAQALAALPLQVEWVNLGWVDSDAWRFIVEDIQGELALRIASGLQTRGLVEELAAAVAASPWVRTVRRVSLQSDGVIRIQAEFRQPIAVVIGERSAYPVARDGVRLALRGYQLSPAEAAGTGYFLISGVREAPPPEGEAWQSAELANALELVRFLEDRYDWSKPPFAALRRQISAIDPARHATLRSGAQIPCTARCLRIHTRDGGLIDWGLPPGAEEGIEAPATEKVDRLVAIAQNGLPADRLLDLRGIDRYEWVLLAPPPSPPSSASPPPAGGGADSRRRR